MADNNIQTVTKSLNLLKLLSLLVVAWFLFIFNIERLDINNHPIVNFPNSTYVITVFLGLAFLLFPNLQRVKFSIMLVFAVGFDSALHLVLGAINFDPTTFFLTVIATIGTFKAFNHIWIMQEQAARDTVDTTSVLIFRTFRSDGQFGEAAAMAFVLFGIILILSQIQNRIGERMVFYG